MERGNRGQQGDPVRQREEDALRRLEAEISRRLPSWRSRGPEDPARVLLETFARAIAGLEEEVDGLLERWLPRLLAACGEEPLWPRAARTAIVLHASENAVDATRVPAGTGVTVRRSGAARAEGRVLFETVCDVCCGPAKLERAVVLDGEVVRDLPTTSLGESTPLFRSVRLRRHLYLGDVAWDAIRNRREPIVIEWLDAPPSVFEGSWEYSAGGCWRALPVDFAESVDSSGVRALRMRVHGPLPDLRARDVQGVESPWFRLAIRESVRVSLPVPRLAWVPAPVSPGSTDAGGGRPGTRRPIARLLLESGESWEDHSLVTSRSIAGRPISQEWQPTVYLGWDRPVAGSVFCKMAREGAVDLHVAGDPRAPRLIWECSSSDEFRPLEVADGSHGFTRSGTIAWEAGDEWRHAERFGQDLFWIRARWVGGSYLEPPVVDAVLAGAVEVVEGRSIESLPVCLAFDSRTGRAPLPPHADGEIEPFEQLEVRARSAADGREGGESGASSSWRVLDRVEDHEPLDADHFRLSCDVEGAVFVEIASSVAGTLDARIPRARVGVGRAGDLVAGTLDVLEAEINGVARISHPLEIHGGRPLETRDGFLRRVDAERRSGARAVTAEDYRALARAFDPTLARVDAIVAPGHAAEVWVLVLTAQACDESSSEPEPISSRRLLRLESYLGERAPLGTVVRVLEPRRIPVRVDVYLPADAVSPERVSNDQARDLARLETELRQHLHPTSGGAGGGIALLDALTAESLRPLIDSFSWSSSTEEPVRVEIETGLDESAGFGAPIGLPVLEAVVPILCRDVRPDPSGDPEASGGSRPGAMEES